MADGNLAEVAGWVRWWNTEIQVNPTQVSAHMGHPVLSTCELQHLTFLPNPFQISIQALILPTTGGLACKAIWRPLADGAHLLRSLCASNSCWADVLGLLQVEMALQSGYLGCNTGNGEKLSNSQAC